MAAKKFVPKQITDTDDLKERIQKGILESDYIKFVRLLSLM